MLTKNSLLYLAAVARYSAFDYWFSNGKLCSGLKPPEASA